MESIERQRADMIAALFTNPNWDNPDNDRQSRIKELNRHFNEAIELIYDPDRKRDNEPDWNNPFWQGHLRSIARTRERLGIEAPRDTIGEIIEGNPAQRAELDQLRAAAVDRSKQRYKVDQLEG